MERICEKCLAYMYRDRLDGWLRCPSCSYMKKEINSMISMAELLGDNKFEDLTPELIDNANELLKRVNGFRAEYGTPMIVNSGYRTPEHNKSVGGSPNSSHCTCQAIDFRDEDGKLFEFIKNNPTVLEKYDLWMENPGWTKTWVHLSSRPVASGKRIFLPYSDGRPATAPERIL